MRSKDMSFIRHGTVVIGLKTISATLVRTVGIQARRRDSLVAAKATKRISTNGLNAFAKLNIRKPANFGFAVAQAA